MWQLIQETSQFREIHDLQKNIPHQITKKKNEKKKHNEEYWRGLAKKKYWIEEAPDSYRIIICIHNKTYVPKEKNYLEQVEVLELDIDF